MGKKLIFVPTYNEKENVEELLKQILSIKLQNTDILFIDDNSPDGTGELLERLAKEHKNLIIKHRSGKSGIGSAHLEAINWAYDNGYGQVVTMDCDLTHDPHYIPDLIKKCNDCDLVIGSRYLGKDRMEEWSMFRRSMTLGAHFARRVLFGLNYDSSNGFRLYRLDKIPRRIFNLVTSTGYPFFFESLHYLNLNNVNIQEIPIKLVARKRGLTKLRVSDIASGIKYLGWLYLKTLLHKDKLILERNRNDKSS